MISALGWGLVAGSAFILGGALALRLKLSTRSVGLLTAFGAGALFAAVAYELVDEAGQLAGGSGRVGIGLIVGSLLYLVRDRLLGVAGRGARGHVPIARRDRRPRGGDHRRQPRSRMTHISLAVIGAIFLCGVPEAFLATGRMSRFGVSPKSVMLIWTALAAVCGVSAGVAYVLLDNTPEARVGARARRRRRRSVHRTHDGARARSTCAGRPARRDRSGDRLRARVRIGRSRVAPAGPTPCGGAGRTARSR